MWPHCQVTSPSTSDPLACPQRFVACHLVFVAQHARFVPCPLLPLSPPSLSLFTAYLPGQLATYQAALTSTLAATARQAGGAYAYLPTNYAYLPASKHPPLLTSADFLMLLFVTSVFVSVSPLTPPSLHFQQFLGHGGGEGREGWPATCHWLALPDCVWPDWLAASYMTYDPLACPLRPAYGRE